jgi:DNA-directed RNA polymerase specialized sigma24 family protein
MPEPGSVTLWLHRLKAGEADALQPLWERYYARLVYLMRQRLRGYPRGPADEEDVALSAFDSLNRGAEGGRFPRLEDRDDLWQVLLLLGRQKATDLVRHGRRQKRGGGKVRELSALATGAAGSAQAVFADLFATEPTPEMAAEVAEECHRRLEGLGDDDLRRVAVAKMDGYSNAEIAAQLGCVVSTVERRLKVIRRLWEAGEEAGA